ncbi:MAG TPA: alanine racemase [Clostridiales bacterium]|nr:alanine racemase [Clostridiales bacterium]
MRQTIARIHLDIYRENIRAMRTALGPDVKLMAVVKSNAYGHGLVQIAQAAQEEQVDFLAVAIAEEGVILRQAGIDIPILVLEGLSERSTRQAVLYGLTLTVHTREHLLHANAAAQECGKPVDVHLKLDTGMNRIGVKDKKEIPGLLDLLATMPMVRLKGAFTHFACADSPDQGMTGAQLARFFEMMALLPKGLLLHAGASSAALLRPDTRFSMVRVGIALYGYPPVKTKVNLRPVLSWETEIIHVKEICPGDSVSYGATMTANRPRKVATLAVGYGDGYKRLLSNKVDVLINGKRCPVLGTICMDQTMADITDAGPVEIGSRAVLIGKDGEEEITADELAHIVGTISYEVLLSISSRVPRTYHNEA